MVKRVKVAVIGLTNLERIGVREVCMQVPEADCQDCRSLRGFLDGEADADAFVVDAETFLLNPAFFMPRRLQTAVVCRYSRKTFMPADSGDEAQPVMIFFDTSEEEMQQALADVIEAAHAASDTPAELSAREKEVIRLVATGLTNREIAEQLCISINTVITHRKNITGKLDIRSVSGLSRYALINGLL